MAVKRITMQDIADACGLSRNTVSKIFNGRGAVPEATRRMVLEKAQELGYRQLAEEVPPARPEPRSQNIALFTSHMPTDYHFGTFFLPAFAGQLGRAGYTLMMYQLSAEEVRQNRLPINFALEQTAGILGIELFSRSYAEMLCDLGLPTIFVDAYSGASTSLQRCDLISMENLASTLAVTQRVIAAGATRIGFVGDFNHCNSFMERWVGFSTALKRADLPLNRRLCILDPDGPQYASLSWLAGCFREMPELPDALICANDFLAIHVMMALKQLGVSVPDQVMVAGFDGTPQSAVLEPSLTTVEIPSADIGRIAANTLLDRIENPGSPYHTIYVKTTPIWRNSTREAPLGPVE